SKQARAINLALRRFSFSFDRERMDDRLVDLLIAAEALYLPKDQDELSFRLAIRSATFVTHDVHSPRHIYEIMREAYRARSQIVHGEDPTRTRLPTKSDATLDELAATVEDLIRVGIREGLAAVGAGSKLADDSYWENLPFARL